jgi:hypothetical protein
LRVFQGGESVTWENFTALQAVSGLLVSFRWCHVWSYKGQVAKSDQLIYNPKYINEFI